jgi:hypothetical protein
MGTVLGIGVRVLEGLREVERRLIRPLGQRLRPPRARRQKAPGGSSEAEELIVALLRTRLRDGDGGGVPLADHIPAASSSSELGALVRALVDVPPRRGVADVEMLRKVA